MSRPPLRSTLFPYTTLFRSPPRLQAVDLRNLVDPPVDVAGDRRPGPHDPAPAAHPGRDQEDPPRQPQADPGAGPDRKSTRLNSSHLVISYAVFCLQKKTPER